jgi:hypothetical protein
MKCRRLKALTFRINNKGRLSGITVKTALTRLYFIYCVSHRFIMTDKQKIELLKSCFDDTIWMAIRYAHGRHTYAPSMVRDAVNNFKKVFPDWELKEDRVIESPDEGTINGFSLRSDYLDDLFSNGG